MKKTLLLLLCIIMAMGMQAQTQTQEHLKFMGIPLDGTISQFHSKLLAKGMKYDAEKNKYISSGARSYEGVFSGEDATIYVYFNPSTKIVYRAKAVVRRYNEDLITSVFNDFKQLLSTKYDSDYVKEGEQDGYPSCLWGITGDYGLYIGFVSLYIGKTGPSYDVTYNLHIDYEDLANEKDNEDKRLEDL